jgi:hypothetical protein
MRTYKKQQLLQVSQFAFEMGAVRFSETSAIQPTSAPYHHYQTESTVALKRRESLKTSTVIVEE